MLRNSKIACCQVRWKSKSSSSTRWLSRQKKDVHTKESKARNYRSRASFKLIEIDKKFKLFNKRSINIVDLGFSPGAWTQVALEITKKLGLKSTILGVDLIACNPPEESYFLQGNILSKNTHNAIKEFFSERTNEYYEQPLDLIISDMMANTLGLKDSDHYASMDLCDGAIILACSLLKENGNMVMKYYMGKEEYLLTNKMHAMFEKVFKMKPTSSRAELREMYIIGLKKKRTTVDDVFGD
ncbi:uncharacterized protein PRCAT00004971001 [Priceomyces carsonii]|uniref:uncharacterized protein n=1 Tax=Priceomyces carsonii TaxID=28549 RepID=UPI002EDA219C|nr:unnamed protein product [Priceomyces carsonii]